MYSPIEQFDIMIKYKMLYSDLVDLSMNNVIIFLLLGFCSMLLLTLVSLMKVKIVPTMGQFMFEIIYKFVMKLMSDQMGKDGFMFFPLLFTFFIFIMIFNLLGLSVLGFAVTSYMLITLFLSLTIWFYAVMLGMYMHKLSFLKMFVADVSWQMVLILILIELMSYMIRAFSLAMSLSANMMAGHILMHIMALVHMEMMSSLIVMMPMMFVLLFLMFMLEMGVAFMQAYVFLMLSCMYFNDAFKMVH